MHGGINGFAGIKRNRFKQDGTPAVAWVKINTFRFIQLAPATLAVGTAHLPPLTVEPIVDNVLLTR